MRRHIDGRVVGVSEAGGGDVVGAHRGVGRHRAERWRGGERTGRIIADKSADRVCERRQGGTIDHSLIVNDDRERGLGHGEGDINRICRIDIVIARLRGPHDDRAGTGDHEAAIGDGGRPGDHREAHRQAEAARGSQGDGACTIGRVADLIEGNRLTGLGDVDSHRVRGAGRVPGPGDRVAVVDDMDEVVAHEGLRGGDGDRARGIERAHAEQHVAFIEADRAGRGGVCAVLVGDGHRCLDRGERRGSRGADRERGRSAKHGVLNRAHAGGEPQDRVGRARELHRELIGRLDGGARADRHLDELRRGVPRIPGEGAGDRRVVAVGRGGRAVCRGVVHAQGQQRRGLAGDKDRESEKVALARTCRSRGAGHGKLGGQQVADDRRSGIGGQLLG